jgi:hypothetical protein
MTTIRHIERADAKSQAELLSTLDELQALTGLTAHVEVGPLTGKWLDDDDPEEAQGTMGVTLEKPRPPQVLMVVDYASDYAKWQKDLREAQVNGVMNKHIDWHQPARFTLTHEWGHVFATAALGRLDHVGGQTDDKYRRLFQIAWDTAGDGHVELADVPQVFEENAIAAMLGLPGIGRSMHLKDLDSYAEVSPNELAAEAFAVHHLAPGVSKVAEAVYEYLAGEFAKHHPHAAA